jgi:serine/threonine protein kinase
MLTNKNKLYSVKLIDFGLGTFIDIPKYLYPRCGTPGFIGPEVILRGNQ